MPGLNKTRSRIVKVIVLAIVCSSSLYFFAQPDLQERYQIIEPLEPNSIYKKFDSHNFVVRASACDGGLFSNEKIFFIGLSSEVHSFTRRSAIRETWGKSANSDIQHLGYRVKLLFFMGKSNVSEENELVRIEASEYDDVVQADFIDAYRNMTLKTMSIFEFARRHCPEASFYLKSDDDCWINIPVMVNRYIGNETKMLFDGELRTRAKPIREWYDRWHVSYGEWAYDEFPDYVSGGGYVLSKSAVAEVYGLCKFFRVISMEDIRMSICAQQVGVNRTNNKLVNTVAENITACYLHRMMIVHPVPPYLLHELWPQIIDLRNDDESCVRS